MTLLLVALVGAAASSVLWALARPVFAAPVLQRTNYRGASVPVAAGVVLVVAVVATEALLVVADALGRDPGAGEPAGRGAVLVAALGFGLLGAFDDLAAHGDDRGFKGHVTSLLRGRLTTGGLKLAGGGLLAVVVVHATGEDRLGRLLLGATADDRGDELLAAADVPVDGGGADAELLRDIGLVEAGEGAKIGEGEFVGAKDEQVTDCHAQLLRDVGKKAGRGIGTPDLPGAQRGFGDACGIGQVVSGQSARFP